MQKVFIDARKLLRKRTSYIGWSSCIVEGHRQEYHYVEQEIFFSTPPLDILIKNIPAKSVLRLKESRELRHAHIEHDTV